MTIADGNDRQGWFNWYVEWAGHHYYLYWVVLMFGDATRVLGEPLSVFVNSGLYIWALMTMVLGFRHDRKILCLRCMKNSPLDPQREVTRWDGRLRLVHWLTPARVGIGFLIWLSMVSVSSWLLAYSFPGPGLVPLWAVLPINVVIWLPWLYFSISGLYHQWLHPWCPYCRRWDEGGDPEVVPDPVPSGEGEKV